MSETTLSQSLRKKSASSLVTSSLVARIYPRVGGEAGGVNDRTGRGQQQRNEEGERRAIWLKMTWKGWETSDLARNNMEG